jgi:predicted kinase
MLIVLSGLPGVGKTTIARALAARIGAVHIRIDSIEDALRQSATSVEPMNDAGYVVGYAVAEDNLRLGLTVIADSVNPWPETRDAWAAAAARAGVGAAEVEIICSDRDEHRRRVELRLHAEGSGPSWHDVVTRDYRPWNRGRLIVDTAGRSTAECVTAVEAAVRDVASRH